MRLQLTVLRHKLPATHIVWFISEEETNSTFTVSKFLSQVNEIIPIEAAHWGLEDYVVTVNNFECLHFHSVGTVFRDGDHIIVRPLDVSEVRARTVSGRNQIDASGKHLVDGIAFGRTYIRQPLRPEVDIPRRKRKYEPDSDSDPEPQLQILGSGQTLQEPTQFFKKARLHDKTSPTENVAEEEDGDDDDEEDDSDFEPDVEESSSSSSDSLDEDDIEVDAEENVVEDVETAEVSHEPELIAIMAPETGDFGKFDESSGSGDSDSESESDDSDTSDDSDDSDDSSEAPSELEGVPLKKTPAEKTTKASESTHKDLDQIKDQKVIFDVPPGEGKKATKKRNERRKEKRRKQFEEASALENKLEQKRKGLLDAIATPVTSTNDQNSGIPPSEPSPRRLRLDVSSSRRMVFGSLGVRTPKTKEEEQKLSAKLMDRNERKPVTHNANGADSTSTEPSIEANTTATLEESSSEGWNSKIVLSAVECVDEGVTLEQPPYPFSQRWDPQYQRNKKSRPVSAKKESRLIKQKKKQELNDDLPEVPSNVSSLPAVKLTDLAVGAVIAFKELELLKENNFTPSGSEYRTARVRQVLGLKEFEFVLAKRDWQPKKEIILDEDGNRVYEPFEMPDTDEGEDDGVRTLTFAGLLVPKLISPAVSAE